MSDAGLPHVVREAEVRIGSLVLRVVHFSDGNRVIPAEDIAKFCAWLGTEELSPDDIVGVNELREAMLSVPR